MPPFGNLITVGIPRTKRRSLTDVMLWGADRLGAPSHITNALRDFNNRIHSFPALAAETIKNKVVDGDLTWKEAYCKADTEPSPLAQRFMISPMENDEHNYSEEELAKMYELGLNSGYGPGYISARSYRTENNGRYAGDINTGNFNSPSKVIEWSIGQASKKGSGDIATTEDNFAYDTKDTKGVYLKKMANGEGNPVIALRSLLGIIGSKGYNNGKDSKTSIHTRVPLQAQEKAYRRMLESRGTKSK